MFSIPRANVVQSDTGFSIEVLGRTGIEYREADKVLFVDSEVLATPAIAIYVKSIHLWKPPFDSEPIPNEKKDEIIRNIQQAIKFMGEEVQLL